MFIRGEIKFMSMRWFFNFCLSRSGDFLITTDGSLFVIIATIILIRLTGVSWQYRIICVMVDEWENWIILSLMDLNSDFCDAKSSILKNFMAIMMMLCTGESTWLFSRKYLNYKQNKLNSYFAWSLVNEKTKD